MTLKQELDLLEKQYEELLWENLDLKKRLEKIIRVQKKKNNVVNNND